MDCVKLDFCTEFKYLDHWLLNNFGDVKNMKKELKALCARVNNLIGCFCDCSVNVKYCVNLKCSVNLKCLSWRTFVNCLYALGYESEMECGKRCILLLIITV